MEVSAESKIKDLVERLDRIATKNKDEFGCGIAISNHFSRGIVYRFFCNEIADNHEFISGVGNTIEAAVDAAAAGIPEALKQWGYKNAK